MQVLKGTKIANGIAIGRAKAILHKPYNISQDSILDSEIATELEGFRSCITELQDEFESYLNADNLSQNEIEILGTHLEILQDPEIHSQITSAISEQKQNLAQAIWNTFSKTIGFFQNMQNDLFAQRALDYKDVAHRMLSNVLREDLDNTAVLDSSHIPIFHEATPSIISSLHRAGIRAYICEKGSPNSHSSILSRSLRVAAVCSIQNVFEIIKDDDTLIVDGEEAKVIIDPDEEELEFYAQKIQIEELIRQKQEKLKQMACETADGTKITLGVNIGIPEELDAITNLKTDGIGLFRTEFLYIARNTLPDEEEQYRIYSKIVSAMAPKTVTIRTFDLGGDKLSHLIPATHEHNPYLGNRGIRFSLAHPNLLKTQLRAILRASIHGKIKIMFPMVIDVEDFIEGRNIFNACINELYNEGVEFDSSIPLGSMVEIPSAALTSDSLARECDFLSIGTNDLVQYTLAVDRNNDAVSRYYIQHHPSVLKLIRSTLRNAQKHKTPVSICGEMASLKEYIPLLIGMGFTEFSIASSAYYEVKSTIQNCDAQLRMIVKNFDFSAPLPKVEELIYHTLKNYLQPTGASDD